MFSIGNLETGCFIEGGGVEERRKCLMCRDERNVQHLFLKCTKMQRWRKNIHVLFQIFLLARIYVRVKYVFCCLFRALSITNSHHSVNKMHKAGILNVMI